MCYEDFSPQNYIFNCVGIYSGIVLFVQLISDSFLNIFVSPRQ
jgi:hypothetical protein